MTIVFGKLRAGGIALVALCLEAVSVLASSGINISSANIAALNSSVSGRLFQGTPVSLPCFPSFNGIAQAADNVVCTAVQAGYTTPEFGTPHFGAFMQVRDVSF